ERARTYFDNLVGDIGPASSTARRDAFIQGGAEMVRFLESKGMKFIHAHWPDYYDNKPGGITAGRSLAAPLFNVNELGEWAPKLAKHPLTSAAPLGSPESVGMFVATKTWGGRWVALKVVFRTVINKILGRTVRGAGNALQGRLFQVALRQGVD